MTRIKRNLPNQSESDTYIACQIPVMNFLSKCFLFLMITVLSANILVAQETHDKPVPAHPDVYFGLGFGLDHGGLGIKAQYLPIPQLALLVGLGYNLVEPAYNGGIAIKLAPGAKVNPYVQAMYGVNGGIKVQSPWGTVHEKNYMGLTAGAGVDIRTGNSGNMFSLAVLAPFRNEEFKADYDRFNDEGTNFNVKLLPVTVSLGFNFNIKSPRKR